MRGDAAERELGRVREGRTGLRGRWVSRAGKGMWAARWEGKAGRRERKRAGLGWAAGWFRFFFFWLPFLFLFLFKLNSNYLNSNEI